MNAAGRWFARHQTGVGLALLAVLSVPPLRPWLEARMSYHMLVQFPLLMAAGALMAPAIPAALRRQLQIWNSHGIAGLTFAAVVLALAMVPRLLDLALVDARVEILKFAALVLCGGALRGSWRRAGLVVQGFFLGNVLPMTVVVGQLYIDAPLRLCNAYRLDEQQWLGQALTWAVVAVAVVWFWQVGRRLFRAAPDETMAVGRG